MEKIVELIDAVLSHPEDEAGLKKVRKKVQTMMEEHPLYK
jgi:glycine/serine hydroxymethyltransferase